MNDNRRKLYDALSEEYDLGSFEQFNADIQNAEKRKKLYDATIGDYDFGDYSSFSAQLGFATSADNVFTEQELKEEFGPEENDDPVVPMSHVFQFGMAPVSMAQATSNAGGGRAEKPLTSLANPYDEKRYSGFSRREIEWLAHQPEEVRREQISDDVLMAQMEKIAREDIDTEELKYQLSELSVKTGAELERYAQERGAKQAQEEEKKPLWRRVLENMPKGGGVASTPDYLRDNASIIGDARWNTLKAADSLNKESQSIIEAVEKDKGFAGGVANKLSDIETWLPMLTAMKSSEILQLVDKFEKGEELTKDEENLLDALAVNVVVKQAYGSDVSNAYSAGQSVAEMPGFMAEMAINPLSGASNMLVSRLGKYAVKKGIGAILRAGAKAVGATAAGAGMAVTTGLPRTAADAMNRMAGQADYEIRDGKVEYAGQVNRESALEAGYKAVAEGAIQNASEMLGAEWATKGVATVGKKVLGKSKAGREVLKALDAIENSSAGKAVKAFQNATKWNGTVEEFIEEIEAGVGSAVFVGDQEIKDVFDRDNLATTFLAVLAPGVTMGAVQTAGAVGGYYTERYRMGRELNRARRVVEELMGEDAAEYIDALDNADEATMNAILKYVDESELPKEQKTAIMKYAAAKLKSDVSTSVLDVLATEEDAELEAAFTQGTETEPTPENRQVARTALQRAEEEMRSRLGWGSEADIELFLREHSAEELAMGDEQTLQAINNYKREKAFVEGMRASIQDRREEKYAEVDKSIDKNANKVDGNVYSTIYNGEEVFITGGNVVLNDNGTVDYDASSDALYITFPDEHTEQVAAKNFTAAVNTESAEDLKAAKHMEIDSELNAELEVNEQQGAPAENGNVTAENGAAVSVEQENNSVAPVVDKKARRAELEALIPIEGKKKQFTKVEPAVTAEYIQLLTDDVAKQIATADKYIANIQAAQEKADPIEALEMDEQIAYWESVKSLLAPQESVSEVAEASPVAEETQAPVVESAPVEEEPSAVVTETAEVAPVEQGVPGYRVALQDAGIIGVGEPPVGVISNRRNTADVTEDLSHVQAEIIRKKARAVFEAKGTKEQLHDAIVSTAHNTKAGVAVLDALYKVLDAVKEGKITVEQAMDFLEENLLVNDNVHQEWRAKTKEESGGLERPNNQSEDNLEMVAEDGNAPGQRGVLLSGEVDENGLPFVVSSNGTTTFGEITDNTGLPAAPIKLSEGYQDENGKGYGLLHIEANHGEQIKNAGFESVKDFVSFVAQNYDENNIRVGKRRDNIQSITYLIQVTDKHDNTLFIELSRDGSYWNVNSGGVFRKGYSNKKETVAKTEPQQPNNAISTGSSLSVEEKSGISTTEPNGEPTVSTDESTIQSANSQENLQESGEIAENGGEKDVIEELREQNRVADERQQRIGLPPRVSDYSKAITEGDAEAMKEWEGRFNDYLSKLLPADIPALDSTIRSMQGNKDAIKAGNRKGYKENPNYKAFDYIEKALKKRKKEIEESVKSEIEERIKNNFAAIETVKQLLESGKEPNDAQREIVSKFDGWAGIEDWHDEIVLRLKDILSDANEYTVEALGNEHAFDGLEGALQKLADNETNTTQAELQQGTLFLDEGTEAFERATKETMNALAKTGVEVVMATEEQVNDMLELAEMQKRKSPETALPEDESSFKGTVISSDDGANILKDIDNAIAEYENKGNSAKTFIGDVARILRAVRHGSKSEYADIVTVNGIPVRIRLADHNVKVSNYDNAGINNGISIVISRKPNAGITNDGDAHLVEFFYSDKKISKAEGKPLVEILKSIKQALYSGEYKDNTGLAQREEVNIPEMMTVFHGSGAKFDKFDHSFMGTGEGAQAYGWGTYVTEVEGIGRTYASTMRDKNISEKHKENAIINNLARQTLASNNGDKNAALEELRNLLNESWSDKKRVKAQIKIIETGKFLPESKVKANLYTVEIPDDNGSNYLHWEERINGEIQERIANGLQSIGFEIEPEMNHLAYSRDDKIAVLNINAKGKDLYAELSDALGGDKQASLFLSDMGFVGISYPANATTGGRADGARNYVIFNENDAQITDRVEFLRTSNGTVYGWAVDGKIYLTPDGVNPNTPVHEYTHLWASAVEQRNPELWTEIVGAMKLSQVWAEVMADEAYRDIWNDDNRVASEVLSRLSGAENYRRAMERAQADIEAERNVIEKIKKIAGWESVKQALSDFWNKVKELLGMPVKGELESDAPAWIEFVDSVIGDFYEGVNPNVENSPMEGMFIGEKGARSLDRREEENGDFNFTPRRGVSTEQREEKMNTRTEELAEALNERGFDTTISKSRTSFGMSNYIIVRSKSGEVLKKIRLSDHSVTNTGRVLNEYHTMSTDTVEGIVADLMGEKEREIGNRISNLTNAKYMESRGKDAKTIKLATGWERGADGKWRYETEDAKVNREAQLFGLNDNKRYPVAGFIEKGRVDIDATVRLDKLVDDEALFDAYPGLREYYVTFEEMEPGTVGSHNYDDKVIRFNRRESIDKLTSTLNHEIQHAVQHIEGFALGSNVERFADVRGAVLDSLNFMTNGDLLNGSAISDVQSLRDALNKKIPYTEMSVKEGYAENLQKVARKYGYENIDALVEDYENMPSAFEQYKRTAGEVESRNVQERMGMTPEERRNSLAEETADVAKEDQIFLFDNQGTSAMMGSRVDARMAQVASELDARELSPEQRVVADVFGGKADNLTISVKTKEGNERKVVMRQGNEAHAGTKHSLYRHYNTGSGAITTDDILLIPEILANGERTENKRGNTKLAVYRLTDGNGTRYTVVTEVKEKGEVFNDFYTNKKASNQTPQMPIGDTQSSARTNDSNAPSADKGNSKSANEQATEEILSQQDGDEVAMTKGAINSLGEKLNTPIKILEDTAGLDERQKKAKGWYDTKTGEVVIVLPNNISLDDAIETALHELVGHKGLRGVMGEAFDGFLDFVYENAAPEMKHAIDYRFLSSIREGRAMTLRECTEEYIASLAERGFDGYSGVWNAIKQWLRDFFRRFANVNVSDGELRYMLWKSYNRLQRGPIAEIEDIAMEDKTNTGDRANRFREVANDGLSNRYDQRVEGIWNQFKEGWIDATRSMKVAQEEIQKEVGRVIVDTADFFNFTNTVPSRNRNKMDRFEVQLMNPFLKFLGRILTDKDISEKDLERYANAKHGIERNREMAVKEAMYDVVDGKKVFNAEAYEAYKKRKGAILTNGKSWIEQQNELDALAASFGAMIKDYSGFTAIFAPDKKVKYADLRKAAVAYVAKMEAELGEEDTKTLWKHIGDINGFSQNEALESGRISKEVFDANVQRYQYYVPLRGFTETTADEMYDYVSEQKSVLNSAQKGAKGRWSEADNIFATMLNIANSEIVFGNKNLAKQRLLNCALLYKTNLLSVGEAWYEKGDNNEYSPIYPNINDAMSNEQIAAEVKAFEERCKEREKKGEVTRKRQGVELKYKSLDKWYKSQHAVSVMRNGREYTVYVNGSPRLAQAMNGLLMEQDTNKFFNVTDAINRFRAKMVTGYSPKFVVTNGVRDIQESTVYFFAKYGVSVAKKFSGNVMNIMPEIHRMFRLYEKNELDMNNEMHRYFKEFLENGGETGYSAMISIQEYEKKINDNIKAKSVLDMSKGALESAQNLVEFANRGVENVCRFAAYMTSRKNGLSVLQSVVDAKNVSVNFNRKGSGAAGNLEARKLFMFLNPAVQSLVRRVELTRKYPKRMAMVWATELALGAALPVIWNVVYDLLGGDDDEALNNYYNLSDFTRRANLCIPLSNGVVKIPLSHEARVLYSLGEVITSAINGHSKYDNVTADVINSFAQILPLNPMEGWAPGDNIGEALAMNLSPDAMKFFPEILLNKDFAGNRIHNASDFNKHLPERLRGKRGTAKVYQMVSDILSGDYERNFFDEQLGEFITPSSIEHIVKSYLGGMYSTANELIKTAQWIGGDEEYAEFKNVPIANAFYQSLEKYEAEPGERTRRDWEKAYQNFFEVVGRDYDTEKTVKGLIKNGDVEALSKLQEMENRGELLRIDIFNDGQKRLKELYEEKDAARNMKDYTLSDEIDKRIYAMKRELVTRMETLADDPMSGYLMLTERDDSEYGVRETYGDARDVNIINEFQRSIKPIIDGAKQSENRSKYTNAYSKEFEIWRKLKRCEDGISKRKKRMENNPDECDRYMMEIRKLRADAVKLINEYE